MGVEKERKVRTAILACVSTCKSAVAEAMAGGEISSPTGEATTQLSRDEKCSEKCSKFKERRSSASLEARRRSTSEWEAREREASFRPPHFQTNLQREEHANSLNSLFRTDKSIEKSRKYFQNTNRDSISLTIGSTPHRTGKQLTLCGLARMSCIQGTAR